MGVRQSRPFRIVHIRWMASDLDLRYPPFRTSVASATSNRCNFQRTLRGEPSSGLGEYPIATTRGLALCLRPILEGTVGVASGPFENADLPRGIRKRCRFGWVRPYAIRASASRSTYGRTLRKQQSHEGARRSSERREVPHILPQHQDVRRPEDQGQFRT
jgi:hypothetical protein